MGKCIIKSDMIGFERKLLIERDNRNFGVENDSDEFQHSISVVALSWRREGQPTRRHTEEEGVRRTTGREEQRK